MTSVLPRLKANSRSLWRPALALLLQFLSTLPAAADGADEIPCQSPEILEPAQDETLTNARPEIRWRAIAGTSHYRVRLRSRTPEGEIVANVDTLVAGERFLLPRALTDFRAIVRVIVTIGCSSEAPEVEAGRRFFIDTAPLCVLRHVALDPSNEALITWEPVASAIEYEAWFYEMPESKLAEKFTTRQTRTSIPAGVKRPAVAAIRPRCDGGYGELRLIELNR